MFFLLRSGLCIGIVYAMLPGTGPSPSLREIASDAGRSAAVKAAHYCTANDQCLHAGARVAASLLAARVGTADPHAGSLSDLLASNVLPLASRSRAAPERAAPGRADARAPRPSGPV